MKIQGMNNDSEPHQPSQSSARFMKNEKLSPDEAARNYASHYYQHSEEKGNISISSWLDGYCFGNNSMMDRYNSLMEAYNQFVAMQPPKPIVVDRKEISLETYKMFIREKIKRDSNGKWWLKVKLWFKFISA